MCQYAPDDVEAAPIGSGDHCSGREVHQDADRGDDREGTAGHVRRVDEAAYSLDHEHHGEDGEGQPVDLGRQDLDPFQTVRIGARGRPCREPHRHQRQPEGGGIGEHVAGVGEQRERPDHEPDDDLADQEGDDQYERTEQQPPVGVGTGCVGMVSHGLPSIFPSGCVVSARSDPMAGSLHAVRDRRTPVATDSADLRLGEVRAPPRAERRGGPHRAGRRRAGRRAAGRRRGGRRPGAGHRAGRRRAGPRRAGRCRSGRCSTRSSPSKPARASRLASRSSGAVSARSASTSTSRIRSAG